MDKRIAIQAVSRAGDGQGGSDETWAEVAQVWAQIEPIKGYERMQAQQLAAPVTHKVTLRWQDWITTAHRIYYESRVFNIKEVINVDEAKQFLKLTCVEG